MNKLYSFIRSGALCVVLLISLCMTHLTWAADWNLKDTKGTHYTLNNLKGKWILVNFWAPWCPSCVEEIPDLISLQQHHSDLQVIGVAVMYGSRKDVLDVVSKQSVPYPIVFGNEDTAGDFGGMDGLPTSFLYSPAGKLISRYEGPLRLNEIEQSIATY